MRITAFALLLLSGWGIGCKEEAPPPHPPAPAETPDEAETPPTAAGDAGEIRVLGPDGAVIVRAYRSGGRWRLKDASGEKIGKLKVQADRVKAKDASGEVIGKVKKKDYGFKVYGPGDRVVFKAKYDGRDGGRLKLKDDGDTEYGRVGGLSGTIQGKAVSAEKEGTTILVKREGATVVKVEGDLPPEPALLLAFDGLTPHQQIAFLVFVKEVL